MRRKNESGLDPYWADPDDAPELTAEMLDDAEVFVGNKFVRRGRRRPPTGNAREIVSFRLDRDLLAKLREASPGGQSRLNGLLRNAIGLPLVQQGVAIAASTMAVTGMASPTVATRPCGRI